MTMIVGILVCVALAVVLVLVAVRGVFQEIPQEDREFQDPLPPAMKLIWPLVNLATRIIGPRLKAADLEKSHRALQAAGQDFLVSPEELAGLRVTGAVLASCIFVLFAIVLGRTSAGTMVLCLALGLPVGWLYPSLWLRERRKAREKRVIRDLPIFLDFITMAVEAGLNITGAIEQAIMKGPTGPLSQEFSRMMRDLRAGLPRAEALRRLADRMDIAQISSFTSALIQADRVGASLGPTLRSQSMQRREERFLRAEKLALEAPVKMMFPLVAFFFPIVFIVLGYFIYLKMVQDGIL